MLTEENWRENANGNQFALFVKDNAGEIYKHDAGCPTHRRGPTAKGSFLWPPLFMPTALTDKIERMLDYATEISEVEASKIDEILRPLGLICDRQFLLSRDYKNETASTRPDYDIMNNTSQMCWVHVISDQHGPCVLVYPSTD